MSHLQMSQGNAYDSLLAQVHSVRKEKHQELKLVSNVASIPIELHCTQSYSTSSRLKQSFAAINATRRAALHAGNACHPFLAPHGVAKP